MLVSLSTHIEPVLRVCFHPVVSTYCCTGNKPIISVTLEPQTVHTRLQKTWLTRVEFHP